MLFQCWTGIPTLLILDEKGSVITSEGWSYMINDPDGAVCRNSC